MEALTEFLRQTAVAMEKPRAYGPFHLWFFFAGLAVAVTAAWLLRKSDDRRNRVILLGVGGFLLLSELYKQLLYTLVLCDGSYPWWIFPFQLCSIPMYLCLIAPFLKAGFVRDCLYNFMLAFNLMGGFVAFLEPSGLLHEYWSLTLHAFVWHMTLVFVGLYLGFSRRAGRKLTDFRYAVLCLLMLSLIAFGLNVLLSAPSKGTANLFFVGPGPSPIVVFKDISAACGWYVCTPLYLLALCIGGFLFYAPFCVIGQKKTSSRSRHETPQREPVSVR